MRVLGIFLLFFTAGISLFARKTTFVTIKLNVFSKDSAHLGKLKLSYARIIDHTLSTGNFLFDKKGYAHEKISWHTTLEIDDQYYGYNKIDTVVNTGELDSLTLIFNLYPRYIAYSDSLAVADILNNRARLIIYDKRLYHADQRFHFGTQFGFEYVYEKNPYGFVKGNKGEDEYAVSHYEAYNKRVIDYIDKQHPLHRSLLPLIADSMMYYDLDQLGRTAPINCAGIRVAPYESLPSEFKRNLYFAHKDTSEPFPSQIDPDWDLLLVKFNVEESMAKIRESQDVFVLLDLRRSMTYNYEDMIPQLVCAITDDTFVGDLNMGKNVRSIMIKGRKEIRYLPPDLFKGDYVATVAGRVNYLLKLITGEVNFGIVRKNATPEELEKLKNRWAYYFTHINEWKED